MWAILTPGMGRCWHGWPNHPCKYEEYAVEPHKAPINYRGPIATYTEGLWWKHNPQPAGYGVCAHAIHQCPGLHRDAPGMQDSLF